MTIRRLISLLVWHLCTTTTKPRTLSSGKLYLVKVLSWQCRLSFRQVVGDEFGITIHGPDFLIKDRLSTSPRTEIWTWTRCQRHFIIYGHPWKWSFMDCTAHRDCSPDDVLTRIEECRRITAEHFDRIKGASESELRALPCPLLPSPLLPFGKGDSCG